MNPLPPIGYREAGRGGPPLLCLHGIGGGAASFGAQLADLGRDRRVVAWDMPGYGDSAPLEVVTFAALDQALFELMDRLEIERAHLCGHSIGGMIALDAALTDPDRVLSLSLLATTSAFGARDTDFRRQFLDARLAPLEAGESLAALAPRFVADIVADDTPAAVIDAGVAAMAAVPEQSYRAVLACLVEFDRYRDIETLDKPCCLIAGDQDRNAPCRTMRRMSERLPRAEFHLLEGCGHLVNLEQPGRCNRILSAFLAKSDPF